MAKVDQAHAISAGNRQRRCPAEALHRNLLVAPKEESGESPKPPTRLSGRARFRLRRDSHSFAGLVEHTCPSNVVGHFFMRRPDLAPLRRGFVAGLPRSPDAPNLSPAVITRLTAEWQADYDAWQKRDLSARRYVYVLADGVYLQARMAAASQAGPVVATRRRPQLFHVAVQASVSEKQLCHARPRLTLDERAYRMLQPVSPV
jgi:hypothetical protein